MKLPPLMTLENPDGPDDIVNDGPWNALAQETSMVFGAVVENPVTETVVPFAVVAVDGVEGFVSNGVVRLAPLIAITINRPSAALPFVVIVLFVSIPGDNAHHSVPTSIEGPPWPDWDIETVGPSFAHVSPAASVTEVAGSLLSPAWNRRIISLGFVVVIVVVTLLAVVFDPSTVSVIMIVRWQRIPMLKPQNPR